MDKARKFPGEKVQETPRNVLFETLYFLDAPDPSPAKSSVLLVCLKMVLVTLQWISLLFYQDMPLENWNHYRIFWYCLSLSRPEFAAMTLGIFDLFVYLIAGLLTISMLAFLLILGRIYARLEVPRPGIVKFLVLFPMSLVSGILKIPLFCVFIVCYRYSGHQDSIEYDISFFFNWHFKVICLYIFVVQWLYIYIHKAIMFETRNSLTDKVLSARSTGDLDLLSDFFHLIGVFIHFFMLEHSFVLAYLTSLFFQSALFCKYLLVLPHYSQRMSWVAVACIGVCAFSSLFFLLGHIQNDGNTIFLLLIIISPLLVYFSKILLERRIARLRTIRYMTEVDLHNYDKVFRIWIGKNDFPSVLRNLKENEETRKEKMLYVWEAYILNDMRNQNKKARLILCNSLTNKADLATEFQYFKCYKYLESLSQHPNLKFIKEWKQFEEMKKLDLKSSNNYIKIWKELLSPEPSIKIIQKAMEKSISMASLLKKRYSVQIKKNPQNIEMMALYATMLSDLFGKKDKGLEILQNAINIVRTYSRLTYLNPFSLCNGVLLVRCCPDNTYIIDYASKMVYEILSFPDDSLLGEPINVLLPDYYKKDHDSILSNFMKKSTTDIKLPRNFFLVSYHKHLVFVKLQIEIEINECTPYFLVNFILNKEQSQDQSFLMTPDQTIIAHTEKVCKILNKHNILNKQLQKVLPAVPDLRNFIYQRVEYNARTYFFPTYMMFGHSELYVVYVVTSYMSERSIRQSGMENASCPVCLELMSNEIKQERSEYKKHQEKHSPSAIDYNFFGKIGCKCCANMSCIEKGYEHEDLHLNHEANPSEEILQESDSKLLRFLKDILHKIVNESECENFTPLNSSIKARRKLKMDVKSVCLRLRRGFLLVCLLAALSAIVFNVANRYYNCVLEDDLEVLSKLNRSMFAINTTGLISRLLDLQNRGFVLDFKDISVDAMIEESLRCLQEARDLVIEIEKPFFNKEPLIQMFSYQEDKLSVEKVSYKKFLIETIRHLSVIKEKGDLLLDHDSMFFLYYNGFGDTLRDVYTLRNEFVEGLRDKYSELQTVRNFNNSIVFVCSVSIGLLMVLQIKKLNDTPRFLCQKISAIPENVLKLNYSVLKKRLELFGKILKPFEGKKVGIQLIPDKTWVSYAIICPFYMLSSIFALQLMVFFAVESSKDYITEKTDLSISMNKFSISAMKVFQLSSELPLLNTDYSIYKAMPISISVEKESEKANQVFSDAIKELKHMFLSDKNSDSQDIYDVLFDSRASMHKSGRLGLIAQSNFYIHSATSLAYEMENQRKAISELFYIGFDIWEGQGQLQMEKERILIEVVKQKSDYILLYSVGFSAYSVVFYLLVLTKLLRKTVRFLFYFYSFLKFNNALN